MDDRRARQACFCHDGCTHVPAKLKRARVVEVVNVFIGQVRRDFRFSKTYYLQTQLKCLAATRQRQRSADIALCWCVAAKRTAAMFSQDGTIMKFHWHEKCISVFHETGTPPAVHLNGIALTFSPFGFPLFFIDSLTVRSSGMFRMMRIGRPKNVFDAVVCPHRDRNR